MFSVVKNCIIYVDNISGGGGDQPYCIFCAYDNYTRSCLDFGKVCQPNLTK